MLALHAAWTPEDTFALWAEDPEQPRAARGRKSSRARPHPFAADPARVAAFVGDRPSTARALPLLLPSTKGGPAPSPWLWSESPPDDVVTLHSWVVPAVALSASDAFDWLLSVDAAPPGTVLGDSVRYLAQLARFALALASRGQVVPGIVRRGTTFEARWRPFTADPDDAARRATLVRGLPPLLRVADGTDRAASEVLDGALLALVDACAREGTKPSRRAGRSIEELWLRALGTSDATLPASAEALATKLDGWARLPGIPPDGFRTCFRITSPTDDGPWRLDFLLQAVDDPSLLVPATEVWRTGGTVLRAAGRDLRQPQERLLADLGRAARLAPVVHGALKTARPTGVDVDAAGAWTFLRASAPLLVRSGFGILAPRWWGRSEARLGLRIKASPRADVGGPSVVGLEALCTVAWEVALGDAPLSMTELERLAALKAPLVQVRGQWVELRPEDVDAALAFYRKPPPPVDVSARDVLRLGLGLETGDTVLPVLDLVADGWLGELLVDAKEARFLPVSAPPGFGTTLRPYQERGLGWLLFHDRIGLGACLADDMGLGKTVQLLALLVHERASGARHAPTLLVCPMSLVGNWQREAARFAPGLTVAVHHGAQRGAVAASADLVLTTYALVARDADALARVAWGRVVLDEAQNIKNAGTRQAKAIHGLDTPRRIALTGTPVENRLSELWSILQFLNPGLLGTAHAFHRTFAVPVERYGDEAAAARLKRVTGPFVLRRLKTDRSIVADLPDKFEMKVVCTLTREQATLYKVVVDDLMAAVDGVDGAARRGAVLGAMTRLKQVCDHPALLLQDRSSLPGRSGKLARLEELLDAVVANGEKALVFTQFAEMGHPLKAHLQERLGREVLFLHGGTSRAARDAMVERFGTAAGPPVFLLSLKAGGTGLNLVAANHVIHFDRWWNPAVEDQATDRAFRIGQTKDVQVRKLVCAGTIEERIDVMIENKRALAGKVVGAGEGWLADLSTTALRALVALDDEAVTE